MTKEIRLGDRVKVEFDAVVHAVGTISDIYKVVGNGIDAWFADSHLTVIPQPIVLPTGKNALIELEGDIWLLGDTEWLSPEGASTWSAEGIANHLRKRPKANYRVIFAGED